MGKVLQKVKRKTE